MARSLAWLAAAGTTALLACGGSNTGPGGEEDPLKDLVCNIPADKLDLLVAAAARGAIDALTTPEFRPAVDAFLDGDDRVLGVAINGEARAYPIDILRVHEVVNDVVGGQPVLISYCPLTASGIAFDPRVQGQTRQFGVSGILFESNLMMFDQSTETLWNQMGLSATCGPDRGLDLVRIPIVETSWGWWRRMHPNTSFMTRNTGFNFNYDFNLYETYQMELGLEFPASTFSRLRPAKELTLGAHRSGDAVAFPFSDLDGLGSVAAVNSQVSDVPLFVMWLGAEQSAVAFDRRVGDQTLTFSVANAFNPDFTDAETGSTWNDIGEAIAGPLQGERLSLYVDAFVAYWFAWSVYFPDLQLFQ